jgi:hypothetical protein
VGSGSWAEATAQAFDLLKTQECTEVAKPEWWSDEGLKALSARVVRAAPTFAKAHCMRAWVLIGKCSAWNAGPRSAVELTAAAAHFDRAAALFNAPAAKASLADVCRAVLLPEVRTLLEPITSLSLCMSS